MKNIEIGTQSLQQFKNADIVRLSTADSVRINNVFGINKEGEVPARFLSGLIPSFTLAQTIAEQSQHHVVPEIRIFRPIHIFQNTNGIEAAENEESLQTGNHLLERFQQRFFPDTNLLVETDQPISSTATAVLDTIKGHIEEHCDLHTVQAIRESGNKHGGIKGETKALIYAAHHPFGWNDLHHAAIFESMPPSVVINTLPPSERKFTTVRETIAPFVAQDSAVTVFSGVQHELTIAMAGTPHYLFLVNDADERQEPSLNDIAATPVAEVLDDMQQRFSLEKEKFLREKLRKVRGDFRNMIDFLTNGNLEARGTEPLIELIQGREVSL